MARGVPISFAMALIDFLLTAFHFVHCNMSPFMRLPSAHRPVVNPTFTYTLDPGPTFSYAFPRHPRTGSIQTPHLEPLQPLSPSHRVSIFVGSPTQPYWPNTRPSRQLQNPALHTNHAPHHLPSLRGTLYDPLHWHPR